MHTKITRVLLLFLALSLAVPTTQALWGQSTVPADSTVYPSAEWARIPNPEGAGYASGALEALHGYVDSISTTGIMVVVGGRVLFQHGDVQQVSYLASVRKSILAMLYGRHVRDGTIRLDRTLRDMGMDDHGGLQPIERNATVGDLVTARSGIYHAASNPGDNLADAPPRGSQRPGEYFLYNNWDFNAAGAAFERATGIDVFDALQRDLATPLGMQDFDRSRHEKSGDLDRSQYPAYHMHLSTRDMARVGYLMLRKGRWAGREIVPSDWVDTIVSVVTPLEEMNPLPLREGYFGYGYMWWVWDGPEAVGPFEGAYTGRGAFGQYITVLPALDMVIAHKTAVPPRRNTSWSDYEGILERLVAARRSP
jgi:CubicO group peptidase (beta-lactamase class C family)